VRRAERKRARWRAGWWLRGRRGADMCVETPVPRCHSTIPTMLLSLDAILSSFSVRWSDILIPLSCAPTLCSSTHADDLFLGSVHGTWKALPSLSL
jgi:hypothetical protein